MLNSDPKTYHVGTLRYNKKTLAVLFCWLMWGDFCFVLMESVVPSIMPLKLEKLGASNTIIGIILTTMPMIINSVANPIISFRSDRYRSRWGRRIPFIIGTLPFLVLCLIGLGFSDSLGHWLYEVTPVRSYLSPNEMAIAVVAFFMILFAFFNAFVCSVFWYLFNDVVPEHLLARFMSWFRVVSTLSGACYGFFIFGFAESHSEAIFLGAAVLYTLGFGIMCLKVKEGQYPPPSENIDGRKGLISSLKTYGKECYSMRHYNYLFLIGAAMAGTMATGPFGILYNKAIGLSVAEIGQISGVSSITMAVCILGSGWLADRFHPIRVVLIGVALQLFVVFPVSMIWLFWLPEPKVVFYVTIATSILVSGPVAAMIGILDPPLFMRYFPRSHYGQFCSANALVRSISLLINGVLAGVYLDVMTRWLGSQKAYICMPIWNAAFFAITLVLLVLLYRSWKRYGGDESYMPPMIHDKGLALEREPECVAIGSSHD